ncbi:MAG: hypothetical protein P8Y23_13175 [Candidatus Lokiarchaeota archaeon]
MRIDLHCHMFQKGYRVEYMQKAFKTYGGYGFYERISKRLENIESVKENDIIEKTLHHINKAKLDKVVLLPVSAKENILLKEWIYSAPDIFIPFYNPPEKVLLNSEVRAQMESDLQQLDFKGLKLMISFRKRNFHDKILQPIHEDY